jgi:UDP-galactopyranose mutase
MKFLVVGAGLSGAVVARELSEAGHLVDVVDERHHVAGNCYTERDSETGVLVHRYGPHLFHTKRRRVVDFLLRFTELRPNQHRVRATTRSGVYSMPLNLLSMNQFFGTKHGPAGMRAMIDEIRDRSIDQPTTFEEQALSMMGDDLYREFFAGYTEKQWGRSPTSLPASILKRLPMRFEYDDRYFADPFEFLPQDGYTVAVERMLDHDGIRLQLGTSAAASDGTSYDHVVWTGPLDAYFGHEYGRLAYRTLDFDWQVTDHPYQGCSVMNYCAPDVTHTRIAEHGYFEPWTSHDRSIIGIETSRECGDADIPYYPVRLTDDQEILRRYVDAARGLDGVTFVGRLGTYRYLDMDASIDEALTAAATMLDHIADRRPVPAFSVDPLG